jgi:hypothetical protein
MEALKQQWIQVLTQKLTVPNKQYEVVSKSFRTGRLERELQIVQLSATRCSCFAILWVSLLSFVTIILYVTSQRMFIVVSLYFIIDSVRKLLDTRSYMKAFVQTAMHDTETWNSSTEALKNSGVHTTYCPHPSSHPAPFETLCVCGLLVQYLSREWPCCPYYSC